MISASASNSDESWKACTAQWGLAVSLVTECGYFWRRAFRVAENDGGGTKRVRGIGGAGDCEVSELQESGIGSSFAKYLDEEIAGPNIRFQSAAIDLGVEIGARRRQGKKHRLGHSHPLGEARVRSLKRSTLRLESGGNAAERTVNSPGNRHQFREGKIPVVAIQKFSVR